MMSKYEKLASRLRALDRDVWTARFDEVQKVFRFPLTSKRVRAPRLLRELFDTERFAFPSVHSSQAALLAIAAHRVDHAIMNRRRIQAVHE